MAIYGVAILGFCYFIGSFLGDLLGVMLHVKANVGGVGFAMFLLIVVTNWLINKNMLSAAAQSGIAFWSAMYIPIVVAMTARQNVVAALKGGPLAIAAGVVAVVVAFALIPVISRLGAVSSANYRNVNN